jgi:PTS system galactitol-specific IIA component
MSLPIFTSEMIFIHPELKDHSREGVIQFLCAKMTDQDYVTDEYFEQVIHREALHPTGLPTLPAASAVPHADPIGVNHTGIALAVLDKPVIFNAMDNPKLELSVSLVFLMSFIKGDQIAVLRWISNVLGSQETVRSITQAADAEGAYRIIEPFLKNNHESRG